MKKKVKKKKDMKQVCSKSGCNTSTGGVYCLGFIGAAVYYISTAVTFWAGVIGILKALVWPAFLIYALFKFLGM